MVFKISEKKLGVLLILLCSRNCLIFVVGASSGRILF